MADHMTLQELQGVVALCTYPEYQFRVAVDGRGDTYLQGAYTEPDTITGAPEIQRTRRWFLSPEMNQSEVVQTVFKCVMTSMEHRTREWFKYMEQPVYGPHFNVEALHAICVAGDFSRRGA